jgi:hypothetical protein
MSDDWFATERVASPPIIHLLHSEQRAITIGLSEVIVTGETVTNLPVTVELLRWRDGVEIDPTALMGQAGYNATTKIASQKIDASKLPLREHVELRVSFDVNFGAGVERRSVYAIVLVTA